MAKTTRRFWIIKHLSNGDVVAKFDTAETTIIPDDVAEYDNFNIVDVDDRSSLVDKTVDQSNLNESEKELLSQVYPVNL